MINLFIYKRFIRSRISVVIIVVIDKRESTSLKHLYDSKVFIEYSNDMDDIYKYIEEYNPNKKLKVLILFKKI